MARQSSGFSEMSSRRPLNAGMSDRRQNSPQLLSASQADQGNTEQANHNTARSREGKILTIGKGSEHCCARRLPYTPQGHATLGGATPQTCRRYQGTRVPGAGLAWGLSMPTPPVSRNNHSTGSISPLPSRILMVSRNANTSLSRSNRDRHTFRYLPQSAHAHERDERTRYHVQHYASSLGDSQCLANDC
jgi:hypothetical protein